MNRDRSERLQIMLTADEIKAIDDWRFKTRMPSRAAAIRELLRRGLGSEGFSSADEMSRSSTFGVLGNEQQSPAKREPKREKRSAD